MPYLAESHFLLSRLLQLVFLEKQRLYGRDSCAGCLSGCPLRIDTCGRKEGGGWAEREATMRCRLNTVLPRPRGAPPSDPKLDRRNQTFTRSSPAVRWQLSWKRLDPRQGSPL